MYMFDLRFSFVYIRDWLPDLANNGTITIPYIGRVLTIVLHAIYVLAYMEAHRVFPLKTVT